MNITDREKEMLDAIASIGKQNLSMKDIADSLGISTEYLINKRGLIAKKNGYYSFIGFICDYVREQERNE